MKSPRLNVVYELSPVNERFFESTLYRESSWSTFTGLPSNPVERFVRRPKLSRYRAVLQLINSLCHNNNTVVISHMPAMSLAVQFGMKFFQRKAPHIAFAFNYTKLPNGWRLKLAKQLFSEIDKFVVFSNFERRLYSEYFDIPLVKLLYIPWTQSPPPVGDLPELPFADKYLCAVGGEGRDYKTLIEAVKVMRIPLVIVGRPDSVGDIDLPENVKFFANLPLATTWAYAVNSVGMVLPLLSSTTCCGQITFVSARMLGIPIVCTDAAPLRDYFDDGAPALYYEAGSVADLSDKLELLFSNIDTYQAKARADSAVARVRFSREGWTSFMERELGSLV